MPLRDHFHPPVFPRHKWGILHAGWPMVMVQHLVPKLPPGFEAAPGVQIGGSAGFETDIAASEHDDGLFSAGGGEGGVATLVWAPPEPTTILDADIPEQDAYEVRVYDAESGQRLVAAVEIVSPRNKDRPQSRSLFTSKVCELLSQDVCVSIVDVVTERSANMYAELLSFLDRTDPILNGQPPAIYAVTMRRRNRGKKWFQNR